MPWLNSLCEAAEQVTSAWAFKLKMTTLAPIERELRKGLAAAFKKQGREFLSRLQIYRDQWPTVESLDRAGSARSRILTRSEPIYAVPIMETGIPGWGAEFDDAAAASVRAFELPLNHAVADSLRAGSSASLATMGMDMAFDLKNPQALAYIQAHGAELVSKVNAVTKGQIRNIIGQAMDGGWGYNETAKALTDKFSQFAFERARMIAVTEASKAYETAGRDSIRTLQDAGIPMEKAWIAEPGACEICQAAADVGWIPADEAFPGGEDTVGDSHPNCRCATEYRRAEGIELGPSRLDQLQPDYGGPFGPGTDGYFDAMKNWVADLAPITDEYGYPMMLDWVKEVQASAYDLIRGKTVTWNPAAREAGHLLQGIRGSPLIEQELFRGINIDKNILSQFRTGQTVDLSLQSFSSDLKVAQSFTLGGQEEVLLKLVGRSQALDLTGISMDELEHLTAGRFLVTKVEVEKIRALEDVWNAATRKWEPLLKDITVVTLKQEMTP